ncbi:MAG: M20/M25/M40 family metallo-hydrolase [Bryobacteraceae bacterium]|nr:M20/M25/M40 family metallo-hydrolase [Bryobacteraceae bacterium]MDW8376550.1 M20/M25/M40 family metallo-hydrolase [Bryobacterales bacterium]
MRQREYSAERVLDLVAERRQRLIEILGKLVRARSENTPPGGAEMQAQQTVAEILHSAGYSTTLYEPDQVPGLQHHPLFWPGRNYCGRPNLAVRRRGLGGGRSLILSGHIDTVPLGSQEWTRAGFGGQVEGNRLYGRGSNDMKAGIAASLLILELLEERKIRLKGDLIFETVVDEEFGGSNGTLAARLAGYQADAAILTEPSLLRVCPAQRGGRIVHLTFRAPGGVLSESGMPSGVVDALRHFLTRLPEFAASRRARAPVHELYAQSPDPVPVSVTKIYTGPWGFGEPMTIPEVCRVELYWQTMPGETCQQVDAEFLAWFEHMVSEAPERFAVKPQLEWPLRWLPGSSISPTHPLVSAMSDAARAALGHPPVICGIEGPCDLYVFHHFGIPAVLWGPKGGNTHAADEYVEIDSLVTAAQALFLFVQEWCGVEQ